MSWVKKRRRLAWAAGVTGIPYASRGMANTAARALDHVSAFFGTQHMTYGLTTVANASG